MSYPNYGPGSFTGAGIDAATPLYDELKRRERRATVRMESQEPWHYERLEIGDGYIRAYRALFPKRTRWQKFLAFIGFID